ncbi:MAG: hypothetical protein J7J17_01750 [Hadesarchaea archaeon]|nr:hypothetical protein [Hadesarchaea archaeon]
MKHVLSPREWYETNRFVKELESSYVPPVVSVYAPSREIGRIVRVLEEEKELRVGEVQTSIAKELDALKRSAGNLCLFGWKEGKEIAVKRLITSGDVPPAHVVDDEPFLEPLHDVLEIRYDVLLVLLDHGRALLRLYRGSEVQRQKKIRSYVMPKHHKGGWSQKRFARIRGEQVERHFKTVQERIESFDAEGVEMIVLAGPGEAKKNFARRYVTKEMADKVVVVEGLDFSSDEGEIDAVLVDQLNRYREKLESGLLSSARRSARRGLTVDENREILKALERGAVETILIASDYYAATPEEDELIIKMIEEAERTSAEVEFITKETVLEELHKHGSVIALLRYRPF